MKDWPPQVWGVFIAIVGAASGWIGKRTNNRADAAAVLTDGALKIVQELQEERTLVRTRLAMVEREQYRERTWCDTRINQLVEAVRELGGNVPDPPPRPEPSYFDIANGE